MSCHFTSATLRYASAVFAVIVCLSVRPSHVGVLLRRPYLRKYIVYYLRYIYLLTEKRKWLVISTIFWKTEYFSKSQPVTYTVNVVISRKRCQIAKFFVATDH